MVRPLLLIEHSRRLLVFLSLPWLLSCSSSENQTVFEDEVMTIAYRVVIGQTLNKREKKEVQKCIDATFSTLNLVYNNWNPQSEVSQINATHSIQKIELSSALQQFLQKADKLFVLSEGRFDPTVAPLQLLWKKELSAQHIPSKKAIAETQNAVGWEKLFFESNTLRKSHPNTALDLCGLSKGYGVDLIVQNLHALGIENLLVEWGGEMRGLGHHPSGRAWKVGILGLDTEVELHNQAIATSGDYYQFWKVHGTIYSHILNPKTYTPLVVTPHSIASATVLAPNCLLADALATTLMLFETLEEAELWVKKIKKSSPGLQVWLRTTSGEALGPSSASHRALGCSFFYRNVFSPCQSQFSV